MRNKSNSTLLCFFAKVVSLLKSGQATNAGIWRFAVLSIVAFMMFVLSDCASADSEKLMQKALTPSALPPAGKSLVIFYRPESGSLLLRMNTSVWDNTHFIGDIGFGRSCAYVCDPGKHVLYNRSFERVGVVDADLLPDRTYVLQLQEPPMAMVRGSAELSPVTGGPELERIFKECVQRDEWVTAGPGAASFEQQEEAENKKIIQDFVYGGTTNQVRVSGRHQDDTKLVSSDKRSRLQHLGPEDHIWVFPDDIKDLSAWFYSVKSKPDEVVNELKALKEQNASGAVPAILPLLVEKNQNSHVLRDACRTLAVIANKDVIPDIEPLLQSPRKDVRKDAQDAILKLQSKTEPI